MNPYAHLERDDGTPADTIADLLDLNNMRPSLGAFERRKDLSERRWLSLDGGRVQVKAVTWRETITNGPSHTTVVQQEGEPRLVVFQLGRNGEPTSGRLVVDRDLFACDIDEQNRVIPRGRLIAEP
jgi:hypothetical protein